METLTNGMSAAMDLSFMFNGASQFPREFNRDIGQWNVRRVTNVRATCYEGVRWS
jgi:hypothetical protein